MVTNSSAQRRRINEEGVLTIELVVAIGILMGTIFPLLVSVVSEQKLARACYYRAVAMEIVDGEIEVLARGESRAFEPGTHVYQPRASAVTNLPAGQFLLTVGTNQLHLEWKASRPDKGGLVTREVKLAKEP